MWFCENLKVQIKKEESHKMSPIRNLPLYPSKHLSIYKNISIYSCTIGLQKDFI